VFADAHAANPVFVLRGLNPSVRDEQNPPGSPDPALDSFDPRNGYSVDGTWRENSHD
jgi:hypothetical protein